MEKKVLYLVSVLANCKAMCNYCFNACLHEEDVKMMKDCIKLDKECAEICGLTLSLIASDSPFSKEILSLCSKACQKCADECKKHHYDHCQDCARACSQCAEACNEYE